MSSRQPPSLCAHLTPTTQSEQPCLPPTVGSEAESALGAAKRQHRRCWLRGLLSLLVCGALALIFAVSLLAAQTTDEPWIEAAMITPRNSHSLTLLLDGRVLAAGGWDGASPLASAEIYDSRTDVWQPASPLREARVFATASLLPDGRVWVAGGWDVLGQALTSTEMYDPQADVWQPGPALTFGRAGHTATLLADGRMLLVGGYTDGGLQARAELYDPATATGMPAGSLRTARAHHTATRLSNGRVLVVGGWDDQGRPLASTELYDPAQNAWQPAAELAIARLDHTATLLPDGTVLVAGGWNGSYLAGAEVYDPARDAWAASGDLNVARAYHAAVLLRDGTVLALGGLDGVRATDSVETYNPQARAWTAASRLHQPYASHLALLLGNGKLLISGRPDSGDVTGNDGYPTPLLTPTPGPRTPGPSDWLLTPLPTATPRADQGTGVHSADAFQAAAEAATAHAAAAAAVTIPNFSTGADDAALYGVHEISFTLATVSNPYAATHFVTFTPQNSSGDFKTVMAFYDGPQGGQDIWKARVYVNHVVTWTWQADSGASGSFTAVAPDGSQLRGMLRVTSGISGSGKRWYTDDGRTFLPMADTAYRLFFDTPSGGVPGRNCPPVRPTAAAQAFVTQYAAEVVAKGINVLRVEVLGTWAYESRTMLPTPPPPPAPSPTPAECETDLSLFWSADPNGANTDLFNATPTIAQLATPDASFYPNLMSFQNTDRKLQWLLNAYPGLYIQMILVPEPEHTSWDHTWIATAPAPSITPILREQLWRTMVARWAAFPNVFWSISNDLNDTKTNTQQLAKEVGCYFAGDASTYCQGSNLYDVNHPHHDPWYQGRPLSLGHLRNAKDSFLSAIPAAPWHSYVTAYSGADLSAQEMDGTRIMPSTPVPTPTPTPEPPLTPFHYSDTSKPVFNVEDQYEEAIGENKEVENPAYFYRRLFWSYLLSGSGATYGAGDTWTGNHTYSTGVYTTTNAQGTPVATFQLAGLDHIRYISDTLANARVDPASFKPNDALIALPTGNADWAEFNRVQVASRDDKEILAYIPNGLPPTSMTYWYNEARRKTAANTAVPESVTVNMSTFTDPNYAVTWYNPTSGNSVGTTSLISGTSSSVSLQAPSGWIGDAVVHISSRCTDPNVCEYMDQEIPNHVYTDPNWVFQSTAGFEAGDDEMAELHYDPNQLISGANSWRCDRPTAPGSGFPGCWVRYDFSPGREIASADFYFRRNSISAYTGVYFMVVRAISDTQIVDGASLNVWLGPGGDLHVDSDTVSNVIPPQQGIASELNRWYHFAVRLQQIPNFGVKVTVLRDGIPVVSEAEVPMEQTNVWFRRIILHTAWWGPTTDLLSGTPSYWWDEFTVDPPAVDDLRGLYKTIFRQGLGYYAGTQATYFDGSGGYNNTALLHVGANNISKGLLRFDVSNIPTNAQVDEAILQLYNTGRSNGNSLTLGVHGVLADWIDAEANRVQRKAGANWNVAGMGSGSDYTAAAAATADITGAGNAWIDLNITDLTQAWVTNPANNLGVVLLQELSSGYVVYDFCSELGWTPCAATQAPKLTLRYHLAPPPPVKATFQQGVGGYSGTNATYFDGATGYNNTSQWHVGAANSIKALLRFDLPTIPITATIDEATLQLYQTSRSNGNSLTLGAHQVQADWVDAEANKTQRQNSVNWVVVGMGSGSDYVADADGTADLASEGGAWIDLDVTSMVQTWATNPIDNHGLVLLQDAASGYVYYNFCSELGWSPCTAAQAPKLTIWYR